MDFQEELATLDMDPDINTPSRKKLCLHEEKTVKYNQVKITFGFIHLDQNHGSGTH